MGQEFSSTHAQSSSALQEALHNLSSKAKSTEAKDVCPKCGYACRAGELVCPNCFSMIIREEAYQAGSTNRLPETEPEAVTVVQGTAERGPLRLTIVETDSCLTLPPKDTLIIGRFSTDDGDNQPDVDLSTFNALQKGVSRRHLQLSRKESLVYVTDLGSTNGTFINGLKLMPNMQRVLRNGDELRFGFLKVKIRF